MFRHTFVIPFWKEALMSFFGFVRSLIGYGAVLGVVYVWTLIGYAAG